MPSPAESQAKKAAVMYKKQQAEQKKAEARKRTEEKIRLAEEKIRAKEEKRRKELEKKAAIKSLRRYRPGKEDLIGKSRFEGPDIKTYTVAYYYYLWGYNSETKEKELRGPHEFIDEFDVRDDIAFERFDDIEDADLYYGPAPDRPLNVQVLDAIYSTIHEYDEIARWGFKSSKGSAEEFAERLGTNFSQLPLKNYDVEYDPEGEPENTPAQILLRMKLSALRLKYSFESEDLENGHCVEDYLLRHCHGETRYHKLPLTFELIREQMGLKNHERPDTTHIIGWCQLHKWSYIVCDLTRKVLSKMKWDNKHAALVFIIAGNHVYPIVGQLRRTLMAANRTTVYHNDMIAKKEVDQYHQVVVKEERTGLIPWLKAQENKTLLVVKKKNVTDLYKDILREENEVLAYRKGDSPRMIGSSIVAFTRGEVDVIACEDYDLVQKYAAFFNIYVPNMTGTGMAATIMDMYRTEKGFNDTSTNQFPFPLIRAVNDGLITSDDIARCETYDMKACYATRGFLYPVIPEPFCVYTEGDQWEEIKYHDRTAWYKIETQRDDYFRGLRMVPRNMLELADKCDIEYEVTHRFVPTSTLPANTYNDLFRKAYILPYDDAKRIAVIMTGYFAKRRNNNNKLYLTTSMEDAFYYYSTGDDAKFMYDYLESYDTHFVMDEDGVSRQEIHPSHFSEKEPIHAVFWREKSEEIATRLPIHGQMMANYLMALWQMQQPFNPEYIIKIKTDAITVNSHFMPRFIESRLCTCVGYCVVPKLHFYRRQETKICLKKYKAEQETPLVSMEKKDWHRLGSKIDLQNIDTSFQKLAQRVHTHLQTTSLHLCGLGGTGKSKLINLLKQLNKNHIAMAPTNKAALIIGGKTFEKYLGMNGSQITRKLNKVFKNKTLVIVDEISMCNEWHYHILYLIKKSLPHMRFLLVGDFNQCPFISRVNSQIGTYEDSELLKHLCDYYKLELTKCIRADKETFELCKNFRDINIKDFPPPGSTYIGKALLGRNLCYYNATRKKINHTINQMIAGEKRNKMSITEHPDQDFILYRHLPLIATTSFKIPRNINIPTEEQPGYYVCNSEYFTVSSFDDEEFCLYNTSGQEFTLPISFVYKFTVNYCTTVFRAQGETFSEPYTVYDWEKMTDKMQYTALSRAAAKALIHIDQALACLPEDSIQIEQVVGSDSVVTPVEVLPGATWHMDPQALASFDDI